jgi:UDP-N-acetylglucosamine/UDP-N-acetylgalactosamine diphosphorylase
MKSPSEVQLAPNGNGALFESISTNRLVKGHIQSADYVQVIGVDNVLNKIMDPLQVGFTAVKGLEASLKCCVKRSPDEKVGVVCQRNGKYDIVEYSELPKEDAERTDENGDLYLDLGSILIFMLSSKKLIKLSSDTATLNKLYHKAFKKIEQWDGEKATKPDVENGYKFELFLHNFLPFCDQGKFGALKVVREEEFGPVKNADGAATDTPTTARTLLM